MPLPILRASRSRAATPRVSSSIVRRCHLLPQPNCQRTVRARFPAGSSPLAAQAGRSRALAEALLLIAGGSYSSAFVACYLDDFRQGKASDSKAWRRRCQRPTVDFLFFSHWLKQAVSARWGRHAIQGDAFFRFRFAPYSAGRGQASLSVELPSSVLRIARVR